MKNTQESPNHFDVTKPSNKTIIISAIVICLATVFAIAELINLNLKIETISDVSNILEAITNPIIGLLGAVLVYYALHEQVRVNKLVQQQIEQQNKKDILQSESTSINQLYSNLKSSIDNFNYSTLDTSQFGQGQYATGSEAIYKLFHDFYCDCNISESELSTNPKITELISILEICSDILSLLSKSSIPDREALNTLTKHQFRYRIYPMLHFDIENLSKHHCDFCNKEHGLPDKMVELIKQLDAWTKE
jgi:ABC-type nickel/cobalt efflux system permease component RcnA